MNWGWKIALTYSAFVIFMLLLVSVAMRQDIELVTENYYAEGLNYDKHQEKLRNARSFKNQVFVRLDKQSGDLVVQLPETLVSESASGELEFYRPSDKSLDFKVSMDFSQNGILQKVPASVLRSGSWRLNIHLQSNEKEYLFEQQLVL